jgi:glyoxylase-like metal-dependent hydrolase (beta-lactamase superfamily II)
MRPSAARPLALAVGIALLTSAACRNPEPPAPATSPSPSPKAASFCDLVPRAANQALEHLGTRGGWFEVYRVQEGVFALAEPYQFQEVISYLLVGEKQALLFDSGLGIAPIAPVVRGLTDLPVTVLNSHTHFDHTGGNAEFERVLAMDTGYTRANQRGFPHAALQGEVVPEALCRSLPEGFEPATYGTRTWKAQRYVRDGHQIDLGGRILEILHIPGHTPDAVALHDRANGLLFTGDSFYEGTIWLFVPETDLAAYARSVDRVAALVPRLERVLPAHNGASAAPGRLLELQSAVRAIREGRAKGQDGERGQVTFTFEPFSILTSKDALAGRSGPTGGSGLTPP